MSSENVDKYFGNLNDASKLVNKTPEFIERFELEHEPVFIDDDPLDQIPIKMLEEPPGEIIVDEEYIPPKPKRRINPATIAAMTGMLAGSIPEYLTRRFAEKEGSWKANQSDEAREIALTKAEEKRQRKIERNIRLSKNK